MFDHSRVLFLWAKSDPPHPLWCHLIDVGLVAEILWSEVLGGATRQRLARCLGLSVEETGAWIVWLSALHDLGKATPEFQHQHEGLAQAVRLAGFRFPRKPVWMPHGPLGAVFLQKIFQEELGWDGFALAAAVGAHHGVIEPFGKVQAYSTEPGWPEARRALIALVGEALRLPALEKCQKPSADPVLLNELAGLISYADWIGSSAEHFSRPDSAVLFEGTTSPNEYAAVARQKARTAVKEFGFRPLPETRAACNWAALYKSDFRPNPLQEKVQEILARQPGTRFLLIEAPMGEGKTEAALFAARHWLEHFCQPGMYLGLPTQATSNAMYERVDGWLARVYDQEAVESLLVHGGLLHPAYYEQKKRATYFADWWQSQVLDEEDEKGATEPVGTTAHAWFAPSKRALLAPFGTGTIDQALMGALIAKHHFIRLAGLAGKTIIFDEVHAYDAYTSVLIRRLLEYLARLDCTVVLLSATLPSKARQDLVKAFTGEILPSEQSSLAYPRVIHWVPGRVPAVEAGFATSERAKKDLLLESAPWSLEEALTIFVKRLGDRGCGAFLVNTVDETQQAFRIVEERYPGHFEEALVFHSRVPASDRAAIEQRVLSLFGRDGQRPKGRAILFATQVVEQSLDLDFDLMMSVIAPIDLLLQRSGRLHRHSRPERPLHLAKPVLLVRMPEGADTAPDYEKTGYIYAKALLIRTQVLLQRIMGSGELLRIPADVPAAIEEVYGDAAQPDLPKAWEKVYGKAAADLRQETSQHSTQALGRVLPKATPAAMEEFWTNPKEFTSSDDPEAAKYRRALTRLGEGTLSAVCAHRVDGGLFLDEEGQEPLPLAESDLANGLRAMLARVVRLPSRLSHCDAVKSGNALASPSEWQRHRILRNLRVIVFDGGVAKLERFAEIRIDKRTGIEVIWGRN